MSILRTVKWARSTLLVLLCAIGAAVLTVASGWSSTAWSAPFSQVRLPSQAPSAGAGASDSGKGANWGDPHALSASQPHTLPIDRVTGRHADAVGTDNTDEVAYNWAGLIETGTTFTGISSDWSVPTVEPSQSTQVSATWIGLDGASALDPTIIQIGTTQQTQSGENSYFAWYELYPAPPVYIGDVLPGDHMEAGISQTSSGVWTIGIEDLASSQSFVKSVTYVGPAQSAEWIEEAPVNPSGQILTLADFGSVTFDDLGLGVPDPNAAVDNYSFMANPGGQIIAFPSDVNTSTDSFSVTYGSPSTSTTSNPGSMGSNPIPVQRIFGQDAIGTAIAASQASFPSTGSADAVVLARSDYFADALAGGPLAAAVDGPLLITPGASSSQSLDPRVLTEIQRVLPSSKTVYILGGSLALSPSIDTTLRNLGYKVQRISGSDEYATAVDIAEQLGNPPEVFETTGLSYYDALSAVPAVIANHGAILLTEGSTQAPETATYLAAHSADTRFAIGGPLAAAGADPTAIAIYGQDLYGTAAAVARTFFPNPTSFGAATSASFVDALAGGPVLGEANAPMLLVPSSGQLPSAISDYLQSVASGLTSGTLFGGPLAVGNDVLSELSFAA